VIYEEGRLLFNREYYRHIPSVEKRCKIGMKEEFVGQGNDDLRQTNIWPGKWLAAGRHSPGDLWTGRVQRRRGGNEAVTVTAGTTKSRNESDDDDSNNEANHYESGLACTEHYLLAPLHPVRLIDTLLAGTALAWNINK